MVWSSPRPAAPSTYMTMSSSRGYRRILLPHSILARPLGAPSAEHGACRALECTLRASSDGHRTHSDTTLAMLRAGGEATMQEEKALGSWSWSKNEAVLHWDERVGRRSSVSSE
jgi:hypothetical protein